MIDIESETLRLLRRIADEMGADAELRVKRGDSIQGLVMELVPSDDRAAAVWVVATNARPTSGTTLEVGYSCHVEWGVGDDRSLAAYLKELNEICHAVAAGRFTEEAWFKDDKLVAASGTMWIDTKERTFRSRELFRTKSGSTRATIHYAPYRPS